MSRKASLKTNLAVVEKHGAFYTDGKIQVTSDGKYMICTCGNVIKVVALDTGRVMQTLGEPEDPAVTSFAVSPDDEHLVVAGQNLLLRHWNWAENAVLRSWKAIHVGPVLCMAFDTTSTLLATGGSDSSIKVWDITRQYWTHNFKGHSGIITCLIFHPDSSRLELYSSADDYKIHVWSLSGSSCTAVLDGHFSTITTLAFAPQDGCRLFSGSRDNVVIVWNVDEKQRVKTIPVYETVESLFVLRNGQTKFNANTEAIHFVTAGSKGILRVWNSATAHCVHSHKSVVNVADDADTSKDDKTSTSAYQQLGYCKAAKMFYAVTRDHHIIYFKEKNLKLFRQLIGRNDEILDVQFLGEKEEYVAMATNSHKIKVFERTTWDCQILEGHTDVVLCLGVYKNGKLLLSGSKDNTFRLWLMKDDFRDITCIFVGHGHTLAVSTVAFSRLKESFMVTGGQDSTLKVWPLPDVPLLAASSFGDMHAALSQKAHDKDVNSVDVAPNDKYIATGSQDKTAKIWLASDLSLVGTLKGHARGIWCVRFSPVDQCLVTSSADGKLKIWALTDLTCVKTFEGHESSVLKVCFLTRGMQLVSCGSDGLVKLWTIKTSECVKTFDEHDEKVWALACTSGEDSIVTGSTDSQLVIWKDITEFDEEERQKNLEESVIREQELSNLLHEKKYLQALRLAISLDHPRSALHILQEVLNGCDDKNGTLKSTNGVEQLNRMVVELSTEHLECILRYCVEWNTNSRNCHVAQRLLGSVLRQLDTAVLLALPNMKTYIEALLPYTERHAQRMNRLAQQAKLVQYTWQCMKLNETPGTCD